MRSYIIRVSACKHTHTPAHNDSLTLFPFFLFFLSCSLSLIIFNRNINTLNHTHIVGVRVRVYDMCSVVMKRVPCMGASDGTTLSLLVGPQQTSLKRDMTHSQVTRSTWRALIPRSVVRHQSAPRRRLPFSSFCLEKWSAELVPYPIRPGVRKCKWSTVLIRVFAYRPTNASFEWEMVHVFLYWISIFITHSGFPLKFKQLVSIHSVNLWVTEILMFWINNTTVQI